MEAEENIDGNREIVQDISAFGMFALDAFLDVEDTEKLQYVYDALGYKPAPTTSRQGEIRSTASAEVRSGNMSEPYIVVSRGENFADSNEVWFLAKVFPTLFPFGGGGPRQIEKNMSRRTCRA